MQDYIKEFAERVAKKVSEEIQVNIRSTLAMQALVPPEFGKKKAQRKAEDKTARGAGRPSTPKEPCKVAGCGRPARSKKMCSAHYQAYRRKNEKQGLPS